MIITYHGKDSVRLQQGDLVVSLNQNDSGQVKIGGADPFIIKGPGEYEVSNIFVQGFGSLNTIYFLLLDGLRLVHWGTLNEAKIPETVTAEVGDVDILFVPLSSSSSVVGPITAYRLALTMQPKLIIPLSESEAVLRPFLKEAGSEKITPIDKLVLKKKDLVDKEGEIVVLVSPRTG